MASASDAWSDDQDEDWVYSHIDWNASFPDYDYDYIASPVEPPSPPGRAIYPLVTQPGWRVKVTPYNVNWPAQFAAIKAHIEELFRKAKPVVEDYYIEHIGSTSVPNLTAKPNIDVLVTFQSRVHLNDALEAFLWELPTAPPYVAYTRVPNGGGIRGRESLKLYVPSRSPHALETPERSVYLIADCADNPEGRVQIRCYRSVKQVLMNPNNKDLFEEYTDVKLSLAARTFESQIEYSQEKDAVVRRILRRAGWTEEDIDEKERLAVRTASTVEMPY